jgi:hypothetical protein
MSEKRELSTEETGRVNGGWEFQSNGKYHTWLNGYEIKCPHCGNASADVVKRIGASSFEVAFNCEACRKDFFLRWDQLNNKINVKT